MVSTTRAAARERQTPAPREGAGVFCCVFGGPGRANHGPRRGSQGDSQGTRPLSGCGQGPPWPAGWDVRSWLLPSALARRVASALRMFALIPQRKRRSGTTQNIPDLRVAKAGWAFRSFLCWYSRCQPCSGESPCNAIASRAPGEGFLRAKPIACRQPAKTPIRARLYKAPLAAGKQRRFASALRFRDKVAPVNKN